MTSPRYAPERPFPPYAFIPGRNPHPEKEGGHSYGKKIQVVKEFGKDFYHGVDLFNHGFFWEAHVYWEALWHLFEKKSGPALFLQALIKLAAAQVKEEMGQKSNAREHFNRALEILRALVERGYEGPGELKLTPFLQKLEQRHGLEEKLVITLRNE